MRIIGRPDDIILAQIVEQFESNVVFLESHEHLAMEQLARLARKLDRMAKGFVVFVIHPVQQIRHPANASFCDYDLKLWMRIERAAKDNLAKRLVELHRYCRDGRGELAATGVSDIGGA